jgi:hypothetical protein
MWVAATPAKRFFISMLVRDIELIPAVVDLVDNSVDAARGRAGDDLTDYWVKVDISGDRFEISDNCGGIGVDVARRYAFRFGRPEDFPTTEGSVGQFGIGMKRALFKIGGEFRVESTTETSRFVIAVDVDQWADDPDPDWSFRFDELVEPYAAAAEELGTRISVEQLHQSVAADFELTSTVGALRSEVRMRHQNALEDGLQISVNNERLGQRPPALLYSNDLTPIHVRNTYGADGRKVEFDLYAGLVASRSMDPDDEDASEFRSSDAGWYLYCNNRLLLAADRTPTTGWGVGAAAYHPQYRQFRGYAYLWSDDSSLLPWNTTKTGVDRDSPVFRWAYGQMEDALRAVQTVINRAKKERQEREPDDRALNTAIQTAEEKPLRDIPESDALKAPRPIQAPTPTTQRITYVVDLREFEQTKESLGAPSAAEVGRRTFLYYYEREVDE